LYFTVALPRLAKAIGAVSININFVNIFFWKVYGENK